MTEVNPSDIVLAYLNHKQEVTEEELMQELSKMVSELATKRVFSPIDFTFRKHSISSDVVSDILWGFTYSSLIAQFSNSGAKNTYIMTKYGNRIVDDLLESFMKSDAWDTYVKVRGSVTKVKK